MPLAISIQDFTMSKKSLLSADNVTYEFASGRTLFKGIRVGITEGERIALIGSNGVGKSTFLKILAGLIKPTFGSVIREGIVYYLPQVSTIRQEIKENTVLHFLSSLTDEWWDIENILETKFRTSINISLPVISLSGGELTKLFLAIGLSRHPSLLLLDEPTNHMDFAALEALKNFLVEFTGAFVIVSHKPFFLDQVVNTTWELTDSGLNVYGGNYSAYKSQKETELKVATRTREVAKKELKRARDAALEEQKRAARSRREGRLQAQNRSMGKAARDFFANRASASAGSASKKHEAAVAKATQKLFDSKIKTNKVTLVRLEEGNSNKGRSLIDIQGADLKIGNQLLIENIQLHISSGERIALSGANGSGKSSLIKAVLGIGQNKCKAFLESGKLLVARGIKVVYLDQTYELVNRELTILENVQKANSSLEYQLLRQQLGHFLFFNDQVNKKADILSGGELARLALAIISVSEIDLLVLDEPTNNLDLETVAQIIEALSEYQGAIWVISHDIEFLSKIQINKAFKIKDCGWQSTVYLPDEAEKYYQELLESASV
jgi:ATPase subunit of ABC transporter with duplicated ATPase domains